MLKASNIQSSLEIILNFLKLHGCLKPTYVVVLEPLTTALTSSLSPSDTLSIFQTTGSQTDVKAHLAIFKNT